MFDLHLSAIEQLRVKSPDKFVYEQPVTPQNLINDVMSHIRVDSSASILVLFTVEWALYLRKIGFVDVTVAADNDPIIANACLVFGLKYQDISDVEKNNMKFDVVVGNPPYQDPQTPSRKVWVEILLKSFNLVNRNGILCMITPNSWIVRPDGQKFKKVSKLFSDHQLKFVNLVDPNSYFAVGEDIGYWIVEATPRYKPTIVYAEWNGICESKEIDFCGEKIEFSDSDKLKRSIINKVLHSSNERMPFESELSSDRGIDQLIADNVISKTKTEEFSQELFWTASQIYYTTYQISKPGIRLVLNRSGYFFKEGQDDKYMPIKQDIAIGIGGYGLPFSSVEEAEHARKLLSSKIIRLFVEGQKTSGFNTALTKLPKFDLTITLEELSDYFNLTQEELDYIEATVK